jgi:hypothetical protein
MALLLLVDPDRFLLFLLRHRPQEDILQRRSLLVAHGGVVEEDGRPDTGARPEEPDLRCQPGGSDDSLRAE